VGDGGGGASSNVSEGISQNITLRLGKILRPTWSCVVQINKMIAGIVWIGSNI